MRLTTAQYVHQGASLHCGHITICALDAATTIRNPFPPMYMELGFQEQRATPFPLTYMELGFQEQGATTKELLELSRQLGNLVRDEWIRLAGGVDKTMLAAGIEGYRAQCT